MHKSSDLRRRTYVLRLCVNLMSHSDLYAEDHEFQAQFDEAEEMLEDIERFLDEAVDDLDFLEVLVHGMTVQTGDDEWLASWANPSDN